MGTDPAQAEVSAVPAAPESPRVQLARIAASVVGDLADVRALDPGEEHRYCTWAGSDPIAGVVVIAEGDPGRYGMAVYVHSALVDLHHLAEDLRRTVRRAVEAHGLATHLDDIQVQITDVVPNGDST